MGFQDVAFLLSRAIQLTLHLHIAYVLVGGLQMGFPGCSIPTLLSYTVNIALAYCLCFGRGAPNGIS